MAGPYYFASSTPKRRMVLRRNPNYGGQPPGAVPGDRDRSRRRRRARRDGRRGRPRGLRRRRPARTASPRSTAAMGLIASQREPAASATSAARSRTCTSSRSTPAGRCSPARACARRSTRRSTGARSRASCSAATGPARPSHRPVHPARLPGFRDAAIYPLGGPDLERARRLAGKRRRRAVLYTCNLPACLEHGRVARRNLADIGIDLEVKHFSTPRDVRAPANPRGAMGPRLLQLVPGLRGPVAPRRPVRAAARPRFLGGFHDRRLFRRIRAATRLSDHAARLRAFEQLDADLARAGAAAPFATAATTDFFSDRIGCQVHQPIYGISLGALCVRGE